MIEILGVTLGWVVNVRFPLCLVKSFLVPLVVLVPLILSLIVILVKPLSLRSMLPRLSLVFVSVRREKIGRCYNTARTTPIESTSTSRLWSNAHNSSLKKLEEVVYWLT